MVNSILRYWKQFKYEIICITWHVLRNLFRVLQPNVNDLSGHDSHPFLKCACSFCPVQLRRTSSWPPMGSPCTCYLRRTVSSMQNMLEFTRTWLIHLQTILSHPLIIPTSLRTNWPGTVAPSHISGKSCCASQIASLMLVGGVLSFVGAAAQVSLVRQTRLLTGRRGGFPHCLAVLTKKTCLKSHAEVAHVAFY